MAQKVKILAQKSNSAIEATDKEEEEEEKQWKMNYD